MRQVCDLVVYGKVASTLLSAEQTAEDEDFRSALSSYQQRLSAIANNICEWVSELASQVVQTSISRPACNHFYVLLADAKPSQSAT